MDANKKNALKRAIEKRKGLSPIVVEDYRQNGIEFTEKVRNDLKSANYFVPIISSKSFQKSQWLNQEIGFAFAIFPKENILPIVQKSVIIKLKGFIHDKAEISYNYSSVPKNAQRERVNFRKCIKALLDDIQEKGNLSNATGLNYEAVVKVDYTPTKFNINHTITKDLKLHIKIKLTLLEQSFRVYYRIITDKSEKIWIGFTDTQMSPKGYITYKENSQRVKEQKELTYEFSDLILDTVNERIKMMNDSRYKIWGKPLRVIEIQFRGDANSHEPIHYYFAFE